MYVHPHSHHHWTTIVAIPVFAYQSFQAYMFSEALFPDLPRPADIHLQALINLLSYHTLSSSDYLRITCSLTFSANDYAIK